MAIYGEFITARLQREIPYDVVVATAANVKVGQLVKLDNGAITEVNTLADATHLIAQSDMTMEYGHVPVEYRDYRYSPDVKLSLSPSSAIANFLGVYESKSKFPAAASGNNGKFAFAADEGKIYKSSGSAWADDSSNTTASLKKVAMFKLINKDDIITRTTY